MDTTLFNQMHLYFNQVWKLMEKLIDTVEFHRGVLAVLWQYIYARGFLEFYKKNFSVLH
ncbi:hypothetical protein [Methanosarcina barkeri]|uniref:hypothetical protein n=1 Tax=Methanosarcina barkeri TaxID=2208 RepID=UPI000A573646|nr:hypothetical protein [Methanosarcina barkeri]